MIRLALAGRLTLLCLLLAPRVEAGVVYHFTSRTENRNGVATAGGKVWADGDRYRLQLDPRPGQPHPFDTAISTDSDATATWINQEKRTYQHRTRNAASRSSLLFHLPGIRSSVKGKPRLHVQQLDDDTVTGRPATAHFIEVDYDLRGTVDGTEVRGHVRTEITIWRDKELPPLAFERAVQTGFAEVDSQIANIYAKLGGMTLRSQMTVTRILEGGPPITETTSTTIDELAIQDIEPRLFDMFYKPGN